jgi:ABC-type multidrug transport system permease subunit
MNIVIAGIFTILYAIFVDNEPTNSFVIGILILLYLRLIVYVIETRRFMCDTEIIQEALIDKSIGYFTFLSRWYSDGMFIRGSNNPERMVNKAIMCQAWIESLRQKKK